MQLKEFNILLDIKKHNKIDYIEVVAGDSFSNVLNISLIDGIYPYDLTNTSVEIVFSKPDGTTVQQTDIAVINSAQGRIQCILKTNTIAAPGKVVAEVRILEGETLLTSTRFEFYVRKSLINDETVESSNEFGTLQQVVLDYIAAIQRVNEIEQQVPDEVVNNLNTLTTYVNGLAGVGRSNETVKKNADDLAAHQAETVSQVINTNRDMSLVGVQTITSAPGKKIKSITALCAVNGSKKMSIGVYSPNNGYVIYLMPTTGIFAVGAPYIVVISNDDTTNRTRGQITAVREGSFDITWDHSGTGATGTPTLSFLVQYHGEG